MRAGSAPSDHSQASSSRAFSLDPLPGVEKGAFLRIDDPQIVFDDCDIMGEVVLTRFGMVGKIEKHFIKARQRRGIEAAKLKGAYEGRPATIRPEDVHELRQRGLGATEIAKRLKIGRASVYRVLAA